MAIDTDKIDETVLALLQLTLHGARAWKGHDWEVLDRLHRKGMIENPVGKAKSVVLTDQGLRRASGCSENRSTECRDDDAPPLGGTGLAYDFEQIGR